MTLFDQYVKALRAKEVTVDEGRYAIARIRRGRDFVWRILLEYGEGGVIMFDEPELPTQLGKDDNAI